MLLAMVQLEQCMQAVSSDEYTHFIKHVYVAEDIIVDVVVQHVVAVHWCIRCCTVGRATWRRCNEACECVSYHAREHACISIPCLADKLVGHLKWVVDVLWVNTCGKNGIVFCMRVAKMS